MHLAVTVSRQITSPHVLAIIDYWHQIRAGRPAPEITDVDAVMIPRSALHYVILADLERDPFRIKYRLVGSGSIDLFADYQGKYLDELGMPEGLDQVLHDDYRRAAQTLQPVIGSYPWPKIYGMPVIIDYAIMPLLRNNEVVRFLSAEHTLVTDTRNPLAPDDLVEIPDR